MLDILHVVNNKRLYILKLFIDNKIFELRLYYCYVHLYQFNHRLQKIVKHFFDKKLFENE